MHAYVSTEGTLGCSKEERQKGWNLSDTFEFFEKGIIRTKGFLDGGGNTNATISATKYYERLLREEDIKAESKG